VLLFLESLPLAVDVVPPIVVSFVVFLENTVRLSRRAGPHTLRLRHMCLVYFFRYKGRRSVGPFPCRDVPKMFAEEEGEDEEEKKRTGRVKLLGFRVLRRPITIVKLVQNLLRYNIYCPNLRYLRWLAESQSDRTPHTWLTHLAQHKQHHCFAVCSWPTATKAKTLSLSICMV